MPTGEFGVNDVSRNQQVNVTTLGSEISTGAATAGAITMNAYVGKVTSEALTTAQDAVYTLTITNNKVVAADMAFASIANGTNTQGTPTLLRVTPGAGTLVITVANAHATAQALNGTLVISFEVRKALVAGQPG